MIDRARTGHTRDSVSLHAATTDVALVAGSLPIAAQTAGRDRVWRALYEDHFDLVYRLACRFGVEHGEAEDIAQRVFVVVHRRRDEVAQVRSLAAWLRAITVRVVAEHRRWRRVRRLKQWLLHATVDAATPRVATPEGTVAQRQTQEEVRGVLDRMSPKLRDVLVLLDVEECGLDEAAAILRVPVNTVRSRKRLAREAFLKIWRRRHGAGGHHD